MHILYMSNTLPIALSMTEAIFLIFAGSYIFMILYPATVVLNSVVDKSNNKHLKMVLNL